MTYRKTEKQNHLDLTFVSGNDHNIESASHRDAFQFKEHYSQILLNGEVKAKQMDNICRDSLEFKQSISFLSGLNDFIPENGYERTNGIKDKSKKYFCRESDIKHEQASTTSEEFSHSTPSKEEKKNGTKRKRVKKFKVENSNCSNGLNVDGSDSEILDMSEINSSHKRRKKNLKNVTSNGLNADGSDSEIFDMNEINSSHKRRKKDSKNVTSNSLHVDGSDSDILDMSEINSSHKRRKKNSKNVTSNGLHVDGSDSEILDMSEINSSHKRRKNNGLNADGSDSEIFDMNEINSSHKRRKKDSKNVTSNSLHVDGSDSDILDMSEINSSHKRRKKNSKNVTSNGLHVDGSDSEILDMSEINSSHKRRKKNSKNVTSNGLNADGSDSEIFDMNEINSSHKRRKKNSKNVTSNSLHVDGSDSDILDMSEINSSHKRRKKNSKNVTSNGLHVDGSDSEILDMSEINSSHKRRKNNSKNVTSNSLHVDGSDSDILDMSEINSSHKRRKKNSKNVTSNSLNVDGSDSDILDMSEINSSHKRIKKNSKNVTSENLLKKKEKQDTHIKLDSGTPTKTAFGEHNSPSLVVNLINDVDIIEETQKCQLQKKKKKHKKNNGEISNCSNVSDVNGSNPEIHNDSDILLKARPKKEKSSKAKNFESNKLNDMENITQEANESGLKHGSDSTDLIPSSIDVYRADIKIKKEKKHSENVHRRKSKVGTSERQSIPSLNKSGSNTSFHLKTSVKKIKTEADVSAQNEEMEKSCDIFDQTLSRQEDCNDAIKTNNRASFSENDEVPVDIKEHSLREDASSSNPPGFSASQLFFREKIFQLDFKVPKLHRIVDRASNPSVSQRLRMAEKGIQVKLGRFDRSEDKQILENWQNFIQVYGLEDNPRLFFCLNKQQVTAEAKKIFLFHLAHGMPTRTPYSVFKRFKSIMSRLLKGRFSKEEDDYIASAMKSKDKISVTEIAKRLNRSLLAVSTHMNKLRNAHTRKIKWRGKNAASFIKYLLKVTKIHEKNIDQLKNRRISIEEWQKLSRKLDGVPVRILKPVWLRRLHPALFVPSSSCDLSQIKLKLIESLCENGETNWSSVDWNKYVQQFEGFTSLRLYTLVKQVVNSQVPEKKRGNLKKCLKYLKANKVHIVLQAPRPLYKINYANGKIEEMKPDAE